MNIAVTAGGQADVAARGAGMSTACAEAIGAAISGVPAADSRAGTGISRLSSHNLPLAALRTADRMMHGTGYRIEVAIVAFVARWRMFLRSACSAGRSWRAFRAMTPTAARRGSDAALRR